MSNRKLIIARASGILDRLDEQGHSAIEKAEIFALIQTLMNIEIASENRVARETKDETVQ